jgi:superfamily I DNA/RNA helicase
MPSFLSKVRSAVESRAEATRTGGTGTSTTTRAWSDQQQAIFGWFEKPSTAHLVVRARAGTGKTTTIVEAIRHIRGEGRILLCAFNKRIQVDLAAKLAHPRAEAKTLHALGFGFVRDHLDGVQVDDDVEWDRLDAVETDLGVTIERDTRAVAKKLVARLKNCLVTMPRMEDCLELLADLPESDILTDEQAKLVGTLAMGSLDLAQSEIEIDRRISYDDMLWVPLVKGWVRARYAWVVVDEAQDLNPAQLVLAEGVCKPDGHQVFVGDEKQAIYGFRGADSGCLDRVKVALKATELGLTTTYRCPRSVVLEATRLVPDYRAAPTAPEGAIYDATVDQMRFEVRVGEVILSRTNAPLVGHALFLLGHGTPAVVVGRDLASGLLAIVKRIRGQATTTPEFLEKLGDWHARRRARIEAGARDAKAKRKLGGRLAELDDKVTALRTIAESVQTVALLGAKIELLFRDGGSTATVVTCSTVHKAKGLEWRRVWMLVDTFYPKWSSRPNDHHPVDVPDNVDPEEANIEYVAITRAMKTLVRVRGPLAPPAVPR